MIGDIVYTQFPFSDTPEFKIRPGLVISAADEHGDFYLLKITTKDNGTGKRIPLTPEMFAQGGLPLESFVDLLDSSKTNTAMVVSYRGRLKDSVIADFLKRRIESSTREFSALAHAAQRPGNDPARQESSAGPAAIPYAGRVFTEDEVEAAVSATLDFWLTLGKEGDALEKELGDFLGVKRSILTNSGSSANLLAFSALTSHKLPDHKRIRPGDEVITCAAGFPTTVTPIIQNQAVPVFLDNLPRTGNADISVLEQAYVPGKTKAVMMAHALGNPFELATVLDFCHQHDLWLIEDNCDALGCTYSMPVDMAKRLGLEYLLKIAEKGAHPLIRLHNSTLTAPTGTWGDLSTQSFYPPHHLTMGEGGAINVVKDMKLKVLVESFRDWGRDCWCPSGKDNTCNKRFGWQLGELPDGYDHKYIYSHLGYNLKPLDPQAAIGREQVKKLPAFIEARRRNWQHLRAGLMGLDDALEFSLPTHAVAWRLDGWKRAQAENFPENWQDHCFEWDNSGCRTDCSWFGFMMLVKPEAPFSRTDFAKHLDEHKIGNRMLFGGNLVRQPSFVQLRRDNPGAFRIVGAAGGAVVEGVASPLTPPHFAISGLLGADRIMDQALFIGVYPGLTGEQINRMIECIQALVRAR